VRALGTARPPELALDADPAAVRDDGRLPHERLDADRGRLPVRPAPPEPRLAELDRAAGDDGRELPRLVVEDEDGEQDPDEKGRLGIRRVVVDELEIDHLGCVARAVADLEDARVPTRALGHPRPDVGEQLVHDLL
jgi:hypothetical protein